jgi:hypothetical protein
VRGVGYHPRSEIALCGCILRYIVVDRVVARSQDSKKKRNRNGDHSGHERHRQLCARGDHQA